MPQCGKSPEERILRATGMIIMAERRGLPLVVTGPDPAEIARIRKWAKSAKCRHVEFAMDEMERDPMGAIRGLIEQLAEKGYDDKIIFSADGESAEATGCSDPSLNGPIREEIDAEAVRSAIRTLEDPDKRWAWLTFEGHGSRFEKARIAWDPRLGSLGAKLVARTGTR